jgi:mono/diheme cytochrome c family protein
LSDPLSFGRIFRVAVLALAAGVTPLATGAAPESPEAILARGQYLATAGNCISCHTRAGGQRFAGGLAFATPFGTIYSTNITPDPDTGIGKWSEQDFSRALREGLRPNGEHLYPAFPYTAFTRLSDADVAALYAYFKSVTPVKASDMKSELRFPFNQRWALGMWNALFFGKGPFERDKTRSGEWNRGAYLVQGLGHCGACHSSRNFLGAESSTAPLSGGEYTDKVAGGALHVWSTPNLTSAPVGLRSWSVEELAAYLKTGRNSFVDTFGPMDEVIMNSTQHLTEADVRAIAVYLKSLPVDKSGGTAEPVGSDMLQTGETVYNIHCGPCHLPTGLGGQDESAGARLVGSPVVQAPNPASLINVILYGPQPPVPPLPKRWKVMEGFGDKLADEEIAALATYLRNTWGNSADPVTADQVARQR